VDYKELILWQKNKESIIKTFSLVESFPKGFSYEVIGRQIIRSISSIGANIAEGHSSYEGKEYPHYLKIALRSAYETDHWLQILKSLPSSNKSINNDYVSEIESLNIEVIKMLITMIKRIEEKRNV